MTQIQTGLGALALILTGSLFASLVHSQNTEPGYQVLKKEVNSGKNDVYYQILMKTKARASNAVAIESVCKALDSENRRKFVAFVFLPSLGTSSAYASCGRLPGAKLEVKILG